MHRLSLLLLMGCAPTYAEVTPVGVQEPEDLVTDVPNEVPVANAGADQRVPVGTPLWLNGGSSYDPDGNSLSYAWQVVSAPDRSLATARGRGDTGAFDPDVVGDYEIELTVTDADGATASDRVSVQAVDPWSDRGGRPAPGHVYLLGSISGRCGRGITALRSNNRALVGLDCTTTPESVMVQVDGSFWWLDGTTPREHSCDGRCWLSEPDEYPDGDVTENDPRRQVPCDGEALAVVLGPDRTLARCVAAPEQWADEQGVVLTDTAWQPFALGHGRLALVHSSQGRAVAVVDPESGEVNATDPPLDWQFLRAWRAHEDGFRVAAYDVHGRTNLVEIDASGAVVPIGVYADLPQGTVVRVGSRLDSAGNLYLPVIVNGVNQVLRADLDSDIDPVWSDANDPLVRVGGGGELVTGP